MAYATLAQMRELLPNAKSDAETDALLTSCLDRATDIVEGRLGFAFANYGSTATDKDIRHTAPRSNYLWLPCYKASSLTTVKRVAMKGASSESTETITDYDELDDYSLWREIGWTAGWYRVTAVWGYGAPPASIVQVTLELAINLWRGKDSGQYSDIVGVDGGGAVGYARALTNRQRQVIEDVRVRYGQYGAV